MHKRACARNSARRNAHRRAAHGMAVLQESKPSLKHSRERTQRKLAKIQTSIQIDILSIDARGRGKKNRVELSAQILISILRIYSITSNYFIFASGKSNLCLQWILKTPKFSTICLGTLLSQAASSNTHLNEPKQYAMQKSTRNRSFRF